MRSTLGDRLSIVLCGWDEPRRFRPLLLVTHRGMRDEAFLGGQAGLAAAEVVRLMHTSEPLPWHAPVLVNEVLHWLSPRPDATIVDGTVGLGGHSAALLPRLTTGRLLAIDRDPQAVALARTRLAAWADRVTLFHATYAALPTVLSELGVAGVDGIVLDLGLSSWQLAQPERGLSFQQEGPLDMRFDPTQAGMTAAQLIRRLTRDELTELFRRYGEERYAMQIASAIVAQRRKQPIKTTRDLVTLIETTVPSRAREERLHPATRVFQALRIAVNRELDELARFLEMAPAILRPGGRLVVISFHSLEDRLVKQAFAGWARDGRARVLTRKPVCASEEELAANPRARSAKLRACERLAVA